MLHVSRTEEIRFVRPHLDTKLQQPIPRRHAVVDNAFFAVHAEGPVQRAQKLAIPQDTIRRVAADTRQVQVLPKAAIDDLERGTAPGEHRRLFRPLRLRDLLAHPPQFQTFQHERRTGSQVLGEQKDRPEALTGADRQRVRDLDRTADKRPVAADFDGVARAGAKNSLGQRVELSFRNARAAETDERAGLGFCRRRTLLDSPGVLEPLLILRRLLPAS